MEIESNTILYTWLRKFASPTPVQTEAHTLSQKRRRKRYRRVGLHGLKYSWKFNYLKVKFAIVQ
jgi:hypothetical protein